MMLRFALATMAVLALAGPAVATRHADLVYQQQFKARQKLLADAGKSRPKAPKQELARAPAEAPGRTAEDAGSR